MQETEITLQSVHGRDSVVKPWRWNTHQFAWKGGEVLLGRPPAPSDRYPGLAEEMNSRNSKGVLEGNSRRTDRLCVLLKKDFLSWVRVAHAQVQAAEDTGRPLGALLCPVFAVGRTGWF